METDTASEISSADESEFPNARRRSRDSTCAPEFQQELKEREVLVGDTIHFDVKIAGKPEPKITWSKDGKDLQESSRITFVGDPDTGLYSLLIKKACLDDEGDYRIVASNAGGSISCQAELLVEGECLFFMHLRIRTVFIIRVPTIKQLFEVNMIFHSRT